MARSGTEGPDPEKVRAWRSDPEVRREWQQAGLEGRPAPPIPEELRIWDRRVARDEGNLLGAKAPHRRSRSQPKPPRVWKRTRKKLIQDFDGVCQRCFKPGDKAHHVLPREQGGRDDGSTPLMLLCPPCHRYIHAHPEESIRKGWLQLGVPGL